MRRSVSQIAVKPASSLTSTNKHSALTVRDGSSGSLHSAHRTAGLCTQPISATPVRWITVNVMTDVL